MFADTAAYNGKTVDVVSWVSDCSRSREKASQLVAR